MKKLFLIALVFVSIQCFSQANDNKPRVFNVMMFGAKHDGTTDDRAAIQSAINAAYDIGGGTVYFPNGKYLIHGALVTSGIGVGNPNSQLYIKQESSFTGVGSTIVKLIGETPPSPNASALANYSINRSGVILYSDITGSGTYPSILGAAGNAGTNNLNLASVTVENINFRVKANIASTGPTMSALNLSNVDFVYVNSVVCDIDTSSNLSVYPTAETFGIYMPMVANGAYSAVNNTMVSGYKYGYVFSEHSTGNNVNAWTCEHAFVFSNAPHSMAFGRLCAQWCKYVMSGLVGTITGSGSHIHVIVNELNTEYQAPATGNWYDSRYTIYDSANYIYGEIKYHIGIRGGDYDDTKFNKLGGTNLVANPVGFDVTSTSWKIGGNSGTSGSGFFGTTNNTSIPLYTNNTLRGKLDSAGNFNLSGNDFYYKASSKSLGFNTATPTAPIDISSSINASGGLARGMFIAPTLTATANGDVLSALDIVPSGPTGAFTGVKLYGLRIEGSGGALTNGLIYDISNTRLGIGVIPTSTLHVKGTGGTAQGISLEATSSGSYGAINFYNSSAALAGQFLQTNSGFTSGIFIPKQSALANYEVAGSVALIAGDGAGFLSFATGGYAAVNERMRISSTGLVGIGLTPTIDKLEVSGNLSLTTAGNKIKIATGTNASVGTATLVAGTVTVSTSSVLTASLIYVTVKTAGGTQGFLSVPTITNATSFVINSTSATETSTVNWWVIN